MGDAFVMSSRQAAELDHAFERNGWTAAHVKKLSAGDLLARLLPVVCGMVPQIEVSTDPTFNRDMRKDGWKLLEHAPRCLISAADLEVISFLRSGENYLGGEEIVRRARTEFDCNYSQEDAEFLLDHQNEIPKKLRSYYLIFPGTVWGGSDGDRSVPYLHWHGERWYLHFNWLDDVFLSNYRFVRPRK